MDCSMTGFPVHHQLLKLAQTHVYWVDDAIQSSYPLLYPSCPASRSLSMNQFFAPGGQSIGVSASASILPMNIKLPIMLSFRIDWFPLGLIDLNSMQSKGLSRVFSNTTIQKHQFFSIQLSLWSNSHICKWLPEKPKLSLDGPLLTK